MEPDIKPVDVMERDRDAYRAQDLFDRLVDEGKYDQARKVGWYLLFNHGIDVEIERGLEIIGWGKNY